MIWKKLNTKAVKNIIHSILPATVGDKQILFTCPMVISRFARVNQSVVVEIFEKLPNGFQLFAKGKSIDIYSAVGLLDFTLFPQWSFFGVRDARNVCAFWCFSDRVWIPNTVHARHAQTRSTMRCKRISTTNVFASASRHHCIKRWLRYVPLCNLK